MNGGNRSQDRGAGPLEAALAALVHETVRREVAEEVRRLVREELAGGAGARAEWLTQPAAGRVAGVSPQTIREWQAAGLLSRGRRGRVNAAELRQVLAEGGPRAAPPAAPGVEAMHADEFRQARARRAAQEVLGKLRHRGPA